MISSHRIHFIVIFRIFKEAIQQKRHLRREREQTKKAAKMTYKEGRAVKKNDVPQTNISMFFFVTQSLDSHEALMILKRSTKRTHPRKNLSVYLK